MKALNTTALVLIIIGGINWGLVGFFNYNLVDNLFGTGSMISLIIYGVVGIAALWSIIAMFMKMNMKMDKEMM